MPNNSLDRLLLSSLVAIGLFAAELCGLATKPALSLPPVMRAPADAKVSIPTATSALTPTSPEPSAPAASPSSESPPPASSPSSELSPSAAPSSTPSQIPGTAPGALSGSVATTEQTAESVLVELEATVKYMKDASWGAFTEAQRPDVVFMGGANVVGGVVIPAPGGGGFVTGGYLPARKKWIDYFSMHVNYLAPLLKQEMAAFKMPDGASSDTMEDYAEYTRIADHLPELCSKMLIACQGPKYDNMTIAMGAGMLNEELKRFDKQRKLLYKDIREDFKHTSDKESEDQKQQEKKEKEALKKKEKEQKEQEKEKEQEQKDKDQKK
jgi:hypothetical protein